MIPLENNEINHITNKIFATYASKISTDDKRTIESKVIVIRL